MRLFKWDKEKVDKKFAELDGDKLPQMSIKEYRDGSFRIEMKNLPIPSLCQDYTSVHDAKQAILDWVEKQYQDEVVNTITVGTLTDEGTKPPQAE